MSQDKTYYRYRLLAGRHVENKVMLTTGDIFESPKNLLGLNAGALKFEKVHPATQLTKDVYKSNGRFSAGQLSEEEISKQRDNLRLQNELDERDQEIARLKTELESRRLNDPLYKTPEEELPEENPFEGMTLEQLRKFAKDNEVDLGGATRKSDIEDILKQYLDAAEGEEPLDGEMEIDEESEEAVPQDA